VAAIRAEAAFPVIAAPIRSKDGREALIAGYARADLSQHVWRDAAERVNRRLAGIGGVAMGGAALATVQVTHQIQDDLTFAEELAFPVLFLLALWVFRSLVAALLPIVCGALTILGGLLILRLLDLATPVSTYALNIVIGIGLGLGIDYSLLLVSRYREELARHGPGLEAVWRTDGDGRPDRRLQRRDRRCGSRDSGHVPARLPRFDGHRRRTRRPLAGLTRSRCCPRSSSCSGSGNALSPPLAAAAERTARGERGGWYRFARALMRRPVPVAIAASALPVVCALPFLSIRFTGVDPSVLPTKASSRVVYTALQRDFPTAVTTPIFAVLHGTEADAKAYAARVRAPLVAPPRELGPNVWEVRASSGKPFLDDASQRLVRQMRLQPPGARRRRDGAVPRPEAHARRDAAARGGLLCAVTFVLLWAATRSPRAAAEGALMNLLTLAATFGILVLVFQDGRLEGLLDYRSQNALELTQPIVLFASPSGSRPTTGIFLLTRIREAWDSGLSNRDAVAVGLERTAASSPRRLCSSASPSAASRPPGSSWSRRSGSGSRSPSYRRDDRPGALVPSLMAILGRWNWWPLVP
jgi:RND superfamily putative drug exporter